MDTTISAQPKLRVSLSENVAWAGVILGIAAALLHGWFTRASIPIDPEIGIGYWLGIVGGLMMLVLLLYSLRKRWKPMRTSGSIGFWFRFHMLMGMLGPALILYHARFTLGAALNSQVALFSMLIVLGSGFIGRFFYARVHRGFSGRKLEVHALLVQLQEQMGCLSLLGPEGAHVKALLLPFEQRAVAAGASFWKSAGSLVSLGISTRTAYWEVRSILSRLHRAKAIPSDTRKTMTRLAGEILHAVRRAAAFAFYDRMLRLWHVLHLPLLFLLLATGILHVIAVHQY